jgi:hypothetical protein
VELPGSIAIGRLFGGVPMYIGDLKSLYLLWVDLAKNHRYQTFFDERDITTFMKRAENEGLSFLTTTLPSLGKALDSFHATTVWETPSGFQTDDEGYPIFMGNPIKRALRGESLAVDYVRQMTYVFYKLEVPYAEDLVEDFLQKFKKTDDELLFSINWADNSVAWLIEDTRRIILSVLCNTNPYDIRPYHGSGATACRTKPHDKWHKLRYYKKLDETYPYSETFYYNPTHLVDELDRMEFSEDRDPRARVALVPKDSRGPRVISMEPAELMFVQQGLMRLLYDTIETHKLTSGQINFSDQTKNRELALTASITGNYATLDLSEASDRVSLELVQRVFPQNWVECLEACRSEETILPNGEIVKLNKFAPMGSACCFPVEALVFWASARAICRLVSPKHREVKVYVYGDDIIVPTNFADAVMKGLEMIGLQVNRSKSFVQGPFRESCGGEYHNGMDVTPVRIRKFLDRSHTTVATGADLCNNFIAKFGYDDSIGLIDIVETALGYHFPRTELSLPATIRTIPRACNDVFFRRRWNKNLQRWEHRILQPSTKRLLLRPPNWCELLRKELARDSEGYSARNVNFIKTEVLKPGEYVASHSIRTKWVWTWLG